METNYAVRLSRLVLACCVLPIASAVSMYGQTVANVTGTILSSESSSQYGAPQDIKINLTGNNFALTSTINTDNLVKGSGNPQIVTVNPSAATSDVMPLVFGGFGGSNTGTLTYNGIVYTNLQIGLNINGEQSVVANSLPQASEQYSGSVYGVPFSLTGVVNAYASAPNNGSFSGPPVLTVSFSGGGVFNGTAGGTLVAVIDTNRGGTYTLLANPIDFTTDTTTQGTWSGVYGGEGYLIANGPMQLPGYAAVSVTQASTYTWTPQTSDVRALQNGLNAGTRLASAYYGNNFNVNINFTDNNPHPVALYLLDWDTTGRTETLTVKNANTGAVLDSETISNFHNGVYAIWDLKGNVTINVQGSGGGSAVVSGIFFGPPATILNPPTTSPVSTATFLGTNAAYKGGWEGHYGAAGYSIANGPSSAPTLGSLNVVGASVYTWAGQTADPRALQLNVQDTVGIASAFTQYQSKSFAIDITSPNTPNSPEVLNLYLLDWDNAGRVETITITDLSTGVVLDTETASSFQGGVYYAWKISGNVVVQVTPVGSYSPVVSGIFFN